MRKHPVALLSAALLAGLALRLFRWQTVT